MTVSTKFLTSSGITLRLAAWVSALAIVLGAVYKWGQRFLLWIWKKFSESVPILGAAQK